MCRWLQIGTFIVFGLSLAGGQGTRGQVPSLTDEDRARQLQERDGLDKEFRVLETQGKFREALEVAKQKLAIERRVLGDGNLTVGISYMGLGTLLRKLQDYPGARDC